MLIDWFTVGAQIINFLVLLAILRYFLYARILGAIHAREEAIAKMHLQAEEAIEEAQAEKAAYNDQAEEVSRQKEQHLKSMRKEIEVERLDLLRRARAEIDQKRERWQEQLLVQAEHFVQDLSQEAVRESCALARHILSEMADASLEQQLLHSLLHRLKLLSPVEKREFLVSSSGIVRSGFEIPETLQKWFRVELQKILGYQGEIVFQADSALICGIVLSMGGFELVWEVEEQLRSLEEVILMRLSQGTNEWSSAASTEVGLDRLQEINPVDHSLERSKS